MVNRLTFKADRFCLDDLLPALQWLDRRLEQAVASAQAAYGSEAGTDTYRGFYISQEEVERSLAGESGAPILQVGAAASETFFADLMNRNSWLAGLGRAYNLSAFDLGLVSIAIAPEIELRYERIYAYLQDDITRKRPTVDLALNLLCASASDKLVRRAHFAGHAPLMRQGLLHLIPDPNQIEPPLLAHYLKLDDQIIRLLLGREELEPRLGRFSQLLQPTVVLEQLPLSLETKNALATLTVPAWQTQQPLCLYFHGQHGVGKRRTAEAIANQLGVSLLVADMVLALDLQVDLELTLRLLLREAQYQNAIVYLLMRLCIYSGGMSY
jgi:hypothetical protein